MQQYILKEKLVTPEKIVNINFQESNFYTIFFNFFLNLNEDFDPNIDIINEFKEYKLMKMRECMKLSKTIGSVSLSSSNLLSIEILREFPKFKWNWHYVTTNFAINARDILNNKDLNWDRDGLLERDDFSGEMLKSMNIYSIDSEIIETLEYSKLDILLSPIDPPLFSEKVIPDNEIAAGMDLLITEYPEFFKEISPKLLEKVRLLVINNIKINSTFLIDEFDFPSNDEVFEKKPKYIIDELEEDPLNLKELIKDFTDINQKKYFDLIGITNYFSERIILGYDILPISRKSYLECIKKNNDRTSGEDIFCKMPFFEFEDLDNFPNTFDPKRKIEYMLLSKKLKPEDIMSKKNFWDIIDLIKYYDQEWVFNNIIFDKDISKKEYIKTGKNFVTKIKLMNFSARKDFNYEYVLQFPELFDITMISMPLVFRESLKNEYLEKLEYKRMGLDDLKSEKGRKYLSKTILNIPDIISDEFLTEYFPDKKNHTKISNINIDYLDFYNYLKTKEYDDKIIFETFFYLIEKTDKNILGNQLSGDFICNLLQNIEFILVDSILNKTVTYDMFVEFYPILKKFEKNFKKIFFNYKKITSYTIFNLFSEKDVKESKYTYYDRLNYFRGY